MTSTEPTAPDPDGVVPVEELVLRPAASQDADAVAEVHLLARRGAVPAMPPMVHDEPSVRGWVRSCLARGDEVWVAEVPPGRVAAYARLVGDWLDDLYVRPEWAGQGIGSALLDLVKALRPRGFGLWVFESNEPARRFYRRHGLVEVERTDGAGNEEGAPDVRLRWPGAR